jgi:hypothetical protein
VGIVKGVKRLARWFLGLRILPQFNLAEELLREEGGKKEARNEMAGLVRGPPLREE